MIDFTKLKKLRTEQIEFLTHSQVIEVVKRQSSAININITDKKLLMMIQVIQYRLVPKATPQKLLESMIQHVYSQLKNEGKI